MYSSTFETWEEERSLSWYKYMKCMYMYLYGEDEPVSRVVHTVHTRTVHVVQEASHVLYVPHTVHTYIQYILHAYQYAYTVLYITVYMYCKAIHDNLIKKFYWIRYCVTIIVSAQIKNGMKIVEEETNHWCPWSGVIDTCWYTF